MRMLWIRLAPVLLIFIISACAGGGSTDIKPALRIPDISVDGTTDSFYEEGWRALKEGKPKIALECFEKSNAKEDKLYVAYGYTMLAQKKYAFARRHFRKALDLNPNYLQAELGMAALYEALGDQEKAFNTYARLLAKYPENAWIKIQYQKIKSSQTEFFLNQAETYKNEERYEQYIAALERASYYSPGIIEIKIKIADYYTARKEYDKAVLQYEKILEELPNKEEILIKLADVYERMEKVDAAIMVYKTLLSIKPGDIGIINKINDLKVKFYESDLPPKFKEIFFKKTITREDLAALLGFYFQRYLHLDTSPVIIRDISGSYAREYIVSICSLGIMKVRPDHSFDRFSEVSRASFAVVLDALLQYLGHNGYAVRISPLEEVVEPADISPLHMYYKVIKFLVNTRIMQLDPENKFNSTAKVSPSSAIASIKRILYNIEVERER